MNDKCISLRKFLTNENSKKKSQHKIYLTNEWTVIKLNWAYISSRSFCTYLNCFWINFVLNKINFWQMNATSVILKLVLKKWIDLGWSNERKISEEQMCFLQMIGTPALLDSLPFFYSFVLSIYWYYLSSSTIYLWLYYLFNVIIYLFVLSLHWYYLSFGTIYCHYSL